MIALAAALLLAQAPAPAGAAPGDQARPTRPDAEAPEPADPPPRAGRGDRGRAEVRAAVPAPATDPRDEAVIRELELLEHLGLLQELELFDAAGDPPPRPQKRPAPPPGKPGDAPAR